MTARARRGLTAGHVIADDAQKAGADQGNNDRGGNHKSPSGTVYPHPQHLDNIFGVDSQNFR